MHLPQQQSTVHILHTCTTNSIYRSGMNVQNTSQKHTAREAPSSSYPDQSFYMSTWKLRQLFFFFLPQTNEGNKVKNRLLAVGRYSY